MDCRQSYERFTIINYDPIVVLYVIFQSVWRMQ